MLFNSINFWIFFAIVYVLYLTFKHKWQNRMLLVASYFFYGSWDWRFLSLIFISTLVDYYSGIKIHDSTEPRRRKAFLALSMCTNLGLLGFFKYFDFFAQSFQGMMGGLGLNVSYTTLNIILPVGISFYTFQTMSYTIDVYRNKLAPTKDFLDFALFVAFFPQLVAGPIERAFNLLPMVQNKRTVSLEQISRGIQLITWGLFKKVFIADNLGIIVDSVYADHLSMSSLQLMAVLYAFLFQIYCDFSAYSDIARGLAKLMGFDLMLNFNLPFFAQNADEFWRRWHISLSTWLRDYLYISLGGNKGSAMRKLFNAAATMLLAGLWHGASWTFVLWGGYYGVLLVLNTVTKPFLQSIWQPKAEWSKKIIKTFKIVAFFHMTAAGAVLFRSQSLTQAWEIWTRILTEFSDIVPGLISLRSVFFYSGILIIVQLFQYWKNDLNILYKMPYPLQAVVHGVMFYLFAFHGATAEAFIYFQF